MHNMGCFSNYFLFKKRVCPSMATIFRRVNPFWFHLSYFTFVSLIGFLALKMTNTRNSRRPDDLDVFFTSVSASTVSSMSVVEMEVFSTSQLVIMTILMLIGGEAFVSMLSLILRSKQKSSLDNKMKYRAIGTLARVIFGYLLVVHFLGSSLVSLYISQTPSARDTLQNKALNLPTFAVFLIVSTFTNCGYVPANENMIAFRKNPGLLLIVFPQILLGNTLFPCCLRLVIRVLEKIRKREEYTYMLNNYNKLGFPHLFSTFDTRMLATTSLGFLVLQFVLFCAMEWSNVGLQGLNSYEKLVASLFQAMNARYSGESIVDLSTISTSIIVLFVVMMYLPPYTMFIPTWKKNQEKGLLIMENQNDETIATKLQRKSKVLDFMNMILSPLSTLFIFTFLICITERESLREDPLNFNVLNIIVEVVSAYGNVGYSMGYSCKRRLNIDESCKDMWYGFSGRWSKEGKVVLIVVMVYGRMKKFYLQGGQGWHLI